MFNSVDYLEKYIEQTYQDIFHKYVKLVLAWNRKTNITSKHNTKSRIYDFICEGIALSQLIDNKKSIIVDVGSGGGFPGLVLSILGFDNMHLVEINYKKAAFLQYAIAELGLKAKIHNEDIRKVYLSEVDYITSKAVMKSDQLVSLCNNIISQETKFILCKNSDDGIINAKILEVILSDRLGAQKQYRFITYKA